MRANGEELVEVRAELRAVKQALREGSSHQGMQGERLQRQLLELCEKENQLLSRQLQALQATMENGQGSGEPGAAALVPREPPPGPVKALDRDQLPAVVAHMREYEASPAESTKALRALASLAYASAAGCGNDEAALPQLLRLVRIHADEAMLQLAAMRVLCNMAYDRQVALGRLAAPEAMSAMVTAAARSPPPKEVGAKASEAIARVLAAEVCSDGDGGPPKEEAPAAAAGSGGALGALLAAACREGPTPWQEQVPQLIAQLVSNEVVDLEQVAQRFVSVAQECATSLAAAGWLGLARLLCASGLPDILRLLTDAGAVLQCTRLMDLHLADASVQVGGIEGMSGLVGTRWEGLQVFADLGGMKFIQAAMGAHQPDALLQTKGIRALASGMLWPQDLQAKSGYDGRRGVELTQAASSRHREDQDLQTAAMEALSKYVQKPECAEALAKAGGEQLVREVMSGHPAAEKVQSFGGLVLDGIQLIVRP